MEVLLPVDLRSDRKWMRPQPVSQSLGRLTASTVDGPEVQGGGGGAGWHQRHGCVCVSVCVIWWGWGGVGGSGGGAELTGARPEVPKNSFLGSKMVGFS